MILTNARILTLDRDNSIFDSRRAKIRKDAVDGSYSNHELVCI
jgi:hypothetical protein